jgi:hypothetical protein
MQKISHAKKEELRVENHPRKVTHLEKRRFQNNLLINDLMATANTDPCFPIQERIDVVKKDVSESRPYADNTFIHRIPNHLDKPCLITLSQFV